MKHFLLCLILTFNFISTNATIYTVTNANANGLGSFVAAIDSSNSNSGNDTINFDIPGMPPHIIPLTGTSAFAINDSVNIDGTTQPDNGYTGSCPKVVIDAAGVNTTSILFQISEHEVYINGLWFKNFTNPNTYVLNINSADVYIGSPGKKNLFTNVGNSIDILNDNVQISSNYFGCNCSGTALDPNTGIAISSYSALGDISITDNLISGNTLGIVLGTTSAPSTNLFIKGNKIGTDSTGTIVLGNLNNGISLTNINNLELGGTGSNEGNLVSGNGAVGCLLIACSGTVYGNKIGTDITGNDTLPNDPLNTGYNSAFNCNGYSSITCSLTVGGMGPGERNIIFGNDIAFNIADSSGHYTVTNNLIGQTYSGLVSPQQGLGFQLYYDTNQVLVRDNFIYGVNSALYITDSKRFSAQNNVLGLDTSGLDLLIGNGYSLNMSDSFNIQNNTIRNCSQGIIAIDCNDSYIGMNNIQHCLTPIAMRSSNGTCHHNQLDFNPIAFNFYTVDLYTGLSNAANDDIQPPVILGSNADSTWGTSLPNAVIDLCYDTTLSPMYPQGYSYPLRFSADATGYWVHPGYLANPNNLTAMQTDHNNNSSEFSSRLTLDIHDASVNNLHIYPNPADEFIILKNISGKELKSWQVLDVLGEVAYEGTITNNYNQQIDVRNLLPGYYFLKVSSGSDLYMMKFVKE